MGESPIDLMDRFAKPFPTMVVAQMIGVPEEDSPRFRRWADLQVASLDQTQATPAQDYRPEEFNAYLYELVAQHRASRDRPDDLVTRMIEFRDAEVGPLTDREIVAQLNNVIVGGTETTTHLIGNLFYELARRPDVYQRLRDDRSLVPSAIEESLRLSAPVQFLFRRCPHDATFGEATVPAGSTVAISLLSANRDESRFPDPDTFDVDRGSSVHDHVAFGLGIHFCIGAQLARLEVRLATEAMLDTFVGIALAPGAKLRARQLPDDAGTTTTRFGAPGGVRAGDETPWPRAAPVMSATLPAKPREHGFLRLGLSFDRHLDLCGVAVHHMGNPYAWMAVPPTIHRRSSSLSPAVLSARVASASGSYSGCG